MKTWTPQCQWENIPGGNQCHRTAEIAIAGICDSKHIETYSYCNLHHQDWLQLITISASGKNWQWLCRQCQQVIIEHESQPYEL